MGPLTTTADSMRLLRVTKIGSGFAERPGPGPAAFVIAPTGLAITPGLFF